jgi:hypothetical protein
MGRFLPTRNESANLRKFSLLFPFEKKFAAIGAE